MSYCHSSGMSNSNKGRWELTEQTVVWVWINCVQHTQSSKHHINDTTTKKLWSGQTLAIENILNLRGTPWKKQQKLFLTQISYPYIVWNNVPKFNENCASSFWAMHQSMCVSVVSTKLGIPLWGCTNKFVIHSEKLENHKISTHSKLKFHIILILLFFFDGYLNFYKQGSQGGGQELFSTQKNEKITRAAPILKSDFK